MSYREVTNRSWIGRLGGAFKGIVAGFLALGAGFVLLFWNEGRAVERYKTLEEGGGAVVAVGAERVDPANDGRLVHLSGLAETGETLRDPEFLVEARAIKLRRQVEMYQWVESRNSETRTKLGGGEETVTTYDYAMQWSSRAIDSASFKQPQGHHNPVMPYTDATCTAREVRLGAFALPPFLVAKIDRSEPLAVNQLPQATGRPVHLDGAGYYLGSEPSRPQVGDIRVRFSVVPATEISVVALQSGVGLVPYQAAAGGTLALLEEGFRPAEEMFAKAQQANTVLTWVLRGAGFVLFFVALRMILGPLSVLADVVPAFGSIVGAGTSLIAGLLAAFFASVTIGIAWVVYRPVIGIALLAIAVVLSLVVLRRVKKSDPVMPPPPPAADGPPPVPGS